jgi:uncharacterized membrane protein
MRQYQPDEDEMWRDPNNWKWGIFYFNPNDERLFVPKKIPAFGATLNFANPRSYILFIPLMFFILFVIFAAIFQP